MVFLDTLPKELLLMVTFYLRPTTIEQLALTLNKRVTYTCLSELQPLFARRRHVQSMTARFGSIVSDRFDNLFDSGGLIEMIYSFDPMKKKDASY
jgi:hypothetical protein